MEESSIIGPNTTENRVILVTRDKIPKVAKTRTQAQSTPGITPFVLSSQPIPVAMIISGTVALFIKLILYNSLTKSLPVLVSHLLL